MIRKDSELFCFWILVLPQSSPFSLRPSPDNPDRRFFFNNSDRFFRLRLHWYYALTRNTSAGAAVAEIAQLVERDLAKVEVSGSTPDFRSITKALLKSAWLSQGELQPESDFCNG